MAMLGPFELVLMAVKFDCGQDCLRVEPSGRTMTVSMRMAAATLELSMNIRKAVLLPATSVLPKRPCSAVACSVFFAGGGGRQLASNAAAVSRIAMHALFMVVPVRCLTPRKDSVPSALAIAGECTS